MKNVSVDANWSLANRNHSFIYKRENYVCGRAERSPRQVGMWEQGPHHLMHRWVLLLHPAHQGPEKSLDKAEVSRKPLETVK